MDLSWTCLRRPSGRQPAAQSVKGESPSVTDLLYVYVTVFSSFLTLIGFRYFWCGMAKLCIISRRSLPCGFSARPGSFRLGFAKDPDAVWEVVIAPASGYIRILGECSQLEFSGKKPLQLFRTETFPTRM